MSHLLLGFVAGLITSSLYEDAIKKYLAFERTKTEIRQLPTP
jgi:hypothetical protein